MTIVVTVCDLIFDTPGLASCLLILIAFEAAGHPIATKKSVVGLIILGAFSASILHAPSTADWMARWIVVLTGIGVFIYQPALMGANDDLATVDLREDIDSDECELIGDSMSLVAGNSQIEVTENNDLPIGLRVRLIDSNAWSPLFVEEIVSRIHASTTLGNGLRRCVSENLLTELQAEFIEFGQERNLRIGRYLLKSVLGRGAMGIVYRAEDLDRGEDVALKLFRNARHNLMLIRREMTVIQELAHPNVVAAYEVGASGHQHFIAMELVDGQTWLQLIRQDGHQDELAALNCTCQVARALEQAHERGILHRDVKPGNVMVTPSGLCKLMDLGLSRPPKELKEYDSLALEHRLMFGTIGFASPEQAGLNENVDARSDIYNLGGTLFFALTGKVFVQGDTPQERLKNLTVNKRFYDPSDFAISSEVRELLSGMLAQDPNDRYQTISEVLEDLSRLLVDRGQSPNERTVSVLVVEDNMPEFLVTESLLSRSNRALRVSRAECWAEAENWLSQHSELVIVLLDLNLPDSFSEETIARIPEIVSSRVGVVALTGDSDPETEKSCFAAGATGFVQKRQATSRSLEREIIAAHSRLQKESVGVVS